MLDRKLQRDWEYFLSLESDLQRLSKYIEFTEDNFSCYSTEIAKQILTSGSELDITLKRLCQVISPNKSRHNISDYRKAIMNNDVAFDELVVGLKSYDLSFTPWKEWKKDTNPEWWNAYNNVKHHRDSKFPEANLKNLLGLTSGLYITKAITISREHSANNPMFAGSIITISPEPELFYSHNLFFRGIHHGTNGTV